MPYRVVTTATFDKQFSKLDKAIKRQIIDWLATNIDGCNNPRQTGKALKGSLKSYWRYRIAKDYRVICDIQDDQLVVLALKVGHRSKIYKLKR